LLPSIANDGTLPFNGASGPAPSTVTAGPFSAERIAALMKAWREAIVVKNPEPVERLDRLFAERPSEFLSALMVSAETDPEERVRSFSTRVLGKVRQSESLAVLRRLLNDPSVYVRFNAAWALGELTDRQARATLMRLEQRDPSPLVRKSAGESRRKIEGG
jgi:HEAT repeat protein